METFLETLALEFLHEVCLTHVVLYESAKFFLSSTRSARQWGAPQALSH
jgi:hypothetical protein